jgi:hypothetical protein
MKPGLPHDILSAESYGLPPIYSLAAVCLLALLVGLSFLVYAVVRRSKLGINKGADQTIYVHCRLAARERMSLLKTKAKSPGSQAFEGVGDLSRNMQFGNSLSLRRLLGVHFSVPLESATHKEAIQHLRKNKKTRKHLEQWIKYLERCNKGCYAHAEVSTEQLEEDCESLLVWVSNLEKKSLEVDLLETKAKKLIVASTV